MIFEFGQYLVDIDVEKTKDFYKDLSIISKGCSCDSCQNFENAIDTLSNDIVSFFLALGIDMKKACEVYVNCTNQDGTLSYGGFYHACGKVLKGKSAWVKKNEHILNWKNNETFSITDDFCISFQEQCDLLEDGFPLPVLQIDFDANIPWVLNKENTYL